MDKVEAGSLLEKYLQGLKSRSYQELQELIAHPDIMEVEGRSGTRYQIECQAVWDDLKPGGNLRIIASIDDGRLLSAFMPSTLDFLISPGGAII